MAALERAEVQRIILEAYRYPISRHFLVSFPPGSRPRAFLAAWAGRAAFGDLDLAASPGPLLNLGLTWRGLTAMGAFDPFGGEAAAARAFPWDFREPPDPDSLRVAGPSDPGTWWNSRFDGGSIHALVHVHCRTEETLLEATRELRSSFEDHGLVELVPTDDGEAITGRAFDGSRLHFGYRDGISHPQVDWDGDSTDPDALPRGMFVLGDWLPEAQAFPRREPWLGLVRNGAYMAFAWIRQDVAAFERLLSRGPALRPDLPPADAREWLAAKLMGRWRDGTPLALSPAGPDVALSTANDFAYGTDPDGLICPMAAHVRVVNGRDQPLNHANAAMFPAGFPRVLRRGTPYGPPFAGTEDDGRDRGIVGMFVCANLNRQFYALTRWIGKTDFSDAYRDPRGQDAVAGERGYPGASRRFVIPMRDEPDLEIDLPPLVRLQGVAMALVPSRGAMGALSS